MRKLELLALGAAFIMFSIASSSAHAAVYVNDSFTRSAPYPWIIGCSLSGSFGSCPSAEADVTIGSNQLRISVLSAGGMGAAVYPTSLNVANFTEEVDYTHMSGNFFEVGYDDMTSLFTSVRFDTAANVIHISDQAFLVDYVSYSYPYTTNDLVAVPYDFSGWAPGSTHHIALIKSGQTLKIKIDGSQVYELTDSRLDVHWAQSSLSNYQDSGTGIASFDNAAVSGIGAKSVPEINILFTPASPTTGQAVQVQCYSPTHGLTLHLTMGSTAEPNPFSYAPAIAGNVFFECCSDETDAYTATCNGNVLEVTAAGVAPLVPVTPVYPINATEWTAAGYGWILPFFSAIFLASMFMIVVCTAAGMVGGPYAAVASGLIMTLIYSLMGVYPPFVAILIVLLSIAAGAYIFSKTAGGTHT